MAHTNSTPNYNLPQFLGTDKPAWLTDINNAMSDIDTAIAAAKTTADSADTAVSSLAITVGNHTSQLSTLSGAVTSQGNTLNTVTALIGNGTPTTTDQTIIGAINEINAIVQPGQISAIASSDTNASVLGKLKVLIDYTKLTPRSVLEVNAAGYKTYFGLAGNGTNYANFVTENLSDQFTIVSNHYIGATCASRANKMNVGGATTTDDNSAVSVTDGTVFTIYY